MFPNIKKKAVENGIKGKVIMITGGTGSFGNAATSHLLKYGPKQILIYSNNEKEQFDMANKFPGHGKIRFIMGDVRDKDRVTFEMKGVNLVFHAAALKQVPHCEFFPSEAVLTNILGTHNVLTAAIHHHAERAVVLSTDKAVYPINVMGMTKALMERTMIALSREKKSNTILCGTRYGNVMYTRGSVIPYFVDLIKDGQPLTVTNSKMTRFMMSLEDSVNLVLYALTHGQDGELYVKKSPAATIHNLAKAITGLFGYKKDIEEIGIRPGEKMHESLVSGEELSRTEDCGDYYKITPEVPGMDAKQYYSKGIKIKSMPKQGYTSANTQRLSLGAIKELLLTLPEIKEELKVFGK
ncbi:MAG: polysaccharide biosynthesis protein [bacterium]